MKKLLFLVIALLVPSLAYAAKQCPEGGMPGKLHDWECCKNGWYYNEMQKGYTQLFTSECGCPDEGTPLTEYYNSDTGNTVTNNFLCCKNNYKYNTDTRKYDTFSPEFCGCPDGGKIESDGEHNRQICCKNGYTYNKETNSYDKLSVHVCGCPKDSEIRIGEWNKKYCCKDGFAQSDFEGPLVEPKACGCPDGGQVWKDRFCQKNGYMWNDMTKKYDIPNATLGCPQGSVPSEWGKEYAAIMKQKLPGQKISDSERAELEKHTERMIMQFNSFCCKDGKSYNDKTKKFDVDMPLCKPFPKNPKNLMETLWELCSNGILMCM